MVERAHDLRHAGVVVAGRVARLYFVRQGYFPGNLAASVTLAAEEGRVAGQLHAFMTHTQED